VAFLEGLRKDEGKSVSISRNFSEREGRGVRPEKGDLSTSIRKLGATLKKKQLCAPLGEEALESRSLGGKRRKNNIEFKIPLSKGKKKRSFRPMKRRDGNGGSNTGRERIDAILIVKERGSVFPSLPLG